MMMDDEFFSLLFAVSQYHRLYMRHLFVLFDDDYFLAFSNENKQINKIEKQTLKLPMMFVQEDQ